MENGKGFKRDFHIEKSSMDLIQSGQTSQREGSTNTHKILAEKRQSTVNPGL